MFHIEPFVSLEKPLEMKYAFLIIFSVFMHVATLGQGAKLHAGVLMAQMDAANFTPSGTAHFGYFVGMDARLNEGLMFFNPGIHYVRLGVLPKDSPNFFGQENYYDIVKGRFGFGFKLVRPSYNTTIRGKILGSLNLITKTPDVFEEMYPDSQLNDTFAGIDVGLGLDLSAFTIDLEYEKGLVNAINKVSESKMDVFRLSIGVFF